MVRFRLLLVSPLLLAACSDITGPGPLQVSATTSRAVMTPGDTTAITLTVRNISAKPVTFERICAFDVRVLAAGDNTDVTHRAPRMCVAMSWPLTLQPTETFAQTFLFTATVGSCLPGSCYPDPLQAGDYVIKGVLFYEKGPAVSDPVPLEIR